MSGLEGDVTFDDVDFGYTDEKMVLHNIKLYATPGQKIAFVGSTGAGKTTITNLINRFYDIQDGKIRYDGININRIKKADLRRSLGIVLQDTNLFTGTVMDNIRYGRLDATRRGVHRRGQTGQRRRIHPPAARGLQHHGSPATAPTSARASGSCWPSPGLRWPIPRCSSWTRPPPPLTPAPRCWCSRAWTA